MFYSKYIFITKGKLAPVWLAANWEKKLTKAQVAETSVRDSVDAIIEPQMPLALRVSGQLLHGVVRIYQKKTKYLLEDCSEAFNTLRQQNMAMKQRGGGGGTKGKRTELSADNKANNEAMITLSEKHNMNDIFDSMPISDMSLEEIADQFNFTDEKEDEDFSLMNVARARDILLDEADTFDLSLQSQVLTELEDNVLPTAEEDVGDKLLDSQSSFDEHSSQRKEGHSLLMDALNQDLDISAKESVDGRNKSMEDNWNMNLMMGDDEDLLDGGDSGLSDGGNIAEPSGSERENKALLDNKLPSDPAENSLANESSDLAMDLGSFEGLPSGHDLEMDSALLGDGIAEKIDKIEVVDGDLFESQRVEEPPKPKPKKKRKRVRKPQTDKVTELRSEIISKQLKDTTDITFTERPSAWLRKEPRYLHDRSKESISALFTRPVTKGYCLSLLQLYADTAKIVKRRRLTEPHLEPASNEVADESALTDPHDPNRSSSPPPPFVSDYSLDASAIEPQAAPAPIMSGRGAEPSNDMPSYDSGDEDAGGDSDPGGVDGDSFGPGGLLGSSGLSMGGGSFDDNTLPDVNFDDPLNLSAVPGGEADTSALNNASAASLAQPGGAGDDGRSAAAAAAQSVGDRSHRSSLGGIAAIDAENRNERADGWSTRTHKMFRYLDNKPEDAFSYDEMVSGKARKTAVGFAYELLVLKTHDLIDLEQNEAYGDILLKKTSRFKEIKQSA